MHIHSEQQIIASLPPPGQGRFALCQSVDYAPACPRIPMRRSSPPRSNHPPHSSIFRTTTTLVMRGLGILGLHRDSPLDKAWEIICRILRMRKITRVAPSLGESEIACLELLKTMLGHQTRTNGRRIPIIRKSERSQPTRTLVEVREEMEWGETTE